MILAPWLLLDLRRVEKRGDDCGRSYADGDARLDQLLAALLARLVRAIVVVGHTNSIRLPLPSMGRDATWEAGLG